MTLSLPLVTRLLSSDTLACSPVCPAVLGVQSSCVHHGADRSDRSKVIQWEQYKQGVFVFFSHNAQLMFVPGIDSHWLFGLQPYSRLGLDFLHYFQLALGGTADRPTWHGNGQIEQGFYSNMGENKILSEGTMYRKDT